MENCGYQSPIEIKKARNLDGHRRLRDLTYNRFMSIPELFRPFVLNRFLRTSVICTKAEVATSGNL